MTQGKPDLTKYFLQAAKDNDLRAVKHFVSTQSIDIDALDTDGFTSLMRAIKNNNLEMVNFLIASEADLEVGSDSVVFGIGNINPDSGYTALMIATGTAYGEKGVEILKVIIEAGANTETQASGGQTAIMLAPNAQALELLIKAEANVNAADKRGFTTLMRAAWVGLVELVSILAESDVDFMAKDKNGRTAMDHARENGDHIAEAFRLAGLAA